MIPDELKELQQWTYSFSPEEPKRPKYTQYQPNGALVYEQVLNHEYDGRSIGMYVTKQDPYILGDIDHVTNVHMPFEELSTNLTTLLTSIPTYAEVSPSGKGIRFVYKLPDPHHKSIVTGKNFLGIEEGRNAQINIGPPWMRMTGNQCDFSADYIASVTWTELESVFHVSYAKDRNVTTPAMPTASIREVEANLMQIPMDRNPRILRAYKQVFEEDYQHYNFWMKVLMALHHYAESTNQLVECLSLAIRWSMLDDVSYTGEEDVAKHWQSFSVKKDSTVSHLTLFKLANACYLRWPVPRPQKAKEKKEGVPLKPLNTEVVNMRYMLKFYNIQIYTDIGNPAIYYVTGDTDIMQRYFGGVEKLFDVFYGPLDIEHLVSTVHPWCQSIGWVGVNRKMIKDHLTTAIHQSKIKLDPVKYYFATPFRKLPLKYQENPDYYHKSSFDDLWDCLTIDHMTSNKEREEKLYKCYYRIWLCGFIRSMYYENVPIINNCVLLLTGPEQIRKTSHFRYLLPAWMRDRYISFTTHGFATESSMRDLVKISASSRIVVWDELEQFLISNTEANFKKLIDNTPQTIIDKYETIPRTIRPISIYGATSNLREFKLGSEGSRRIFHIPVKWVDTERMDCICWHKLINDLHVEVDKEIKKGGVPWLLTEKQLKYQANLHDLIRSKNSVDMLLEETFRFESKVPISHGVLSGVSSVQSDKSGRLMTTKQVLEVLTRCHSGAYNVTRPALVHALHRLCSKYTMSEKGARPMIKPAGKIEKGVFYQGPHKKWVMPPMSEMAQGGVFQEVL